MSDPTLFSMPVTFEDRRYRRLRPRVDLTDACCHGATAMARANRAATILHAYAGATASLDHPGRDLLRELQEDLRTLAMREGWDD